LESKLVGHGFQPSKDISRHPTERARIDPANLKKRLSVNQESTHCERLDQLLSDTNGEHYVDAGRSSMAE
jgi:hypothetical protein